MSAAPTTASTQLENRKYSNQCISSLDGYQAHLGGDGLTNLAKVGVSCSDSALDKEFDHSSRTYRRTPESVEDYRNISKHQQSYSVKSAELRRKSEASSNLYRDSELSNCHKQDVFRRKSDVTACHRHVVHRSRGEHRQRGKTVPKDTIVLAHKRRSVVHVSGGSKKKDVGNNALPCSGRPAVTSQPLSGTSAIREPSGNPDWPVLKEDECENNGDNSVKVNHGNGSYVISSVTEGVKGLVKFLHVPFQCCKRKVCNYVVMCCALISILDFTLISSILHRHQTQKRNAIFI